MPAWRFAQIPFVVAPLAAALLLLTLAAPVAAVTHPGSDPTDITPVGGLVFFAASTAAHGRELWVTDGTQAGTHEVADINPAAGIGSSPGQLVAMGGKVYFMADDGSGAKLWKSDGTATGTKPLGAGGLGLLNVNGRLFYMSYPKLWTSDGTIGGTHSIAKIDGIDDWGTFAGLDGFYYFFADDWGDSGSLPQLWKSSGTSAGTSMVAEIAATGPDGQTFTEPSDLVAAGSHVFFRMGEAVACAIARSTLADWGCIGEGRLWQSDGTAVGTRQVAVDGDVYPDLVDFVGKLYFGVDDYSAGLLALFRTDGSDAGTHMVKSNMLPGTSTVVGSRLFIFAWSAPGDALWRTKGTTRTTREVYPIALPECRLFSNDTYCGLDETPAAAGGKLFFPAASVGNGTELWTSDGTPVGTHQVKNIVYGGASSNPSSLTAAGSLLYFAARDVNHGRELWVSDGTARGTHMVMDINPG